MYRIERKKQVSEEFMLGDETLRVEISADALIRDYAKKNAEVLAAQQKLKKAQAENGGAISEQAYEELGAAIISFFQFIFSEENTQKMLAFFENKYVDMLTQVMPFINDVLMPQIKDMLQSEREKRTAAYTGTQHSRKPKFFARRK